jgi:transposase
LEAENTRLRLRVLELEDQVTRRDDQVQRLRAEIARLTKALEEAQRAAKRQAAPFRKPGGPKPEPKTPGRLPGAAYGQQAIRPNPPPEAVTESYAVPLPDTCPKCGSPDLTPVETVTFYQTDLPKPQPLVRPFDVVRGVCEDCGRSVEGRHPLQTGPTTAVATSQLGPDAHAALAWLTKGQGLSHGKAIAVLKHLGGVTVARATSVRSLLRTATRCQAAYQGLRADIRASPEVGVDETGWRVGGRSAWLHAAATDQATSYEVALRRDGEPSRNLLGEAWAGLLTRDGSPIYEALTAARHQPCLDHLRRRGEALLETARGGAVRFPRTVLDLLQAGYAVRRAWEAGALTAAEREAEGVRLACALRDAALGTFTHEGNRKLAGYVLRRWVNGFSFLIRGEGEPTNWRVEQALRLAVVARKVWGGSRTWPGAVAHGVVCSVLRTCWQRGLDGLAFLRQVLTSPSRVRIPSVAR